MIHMTKIEEFIEHFDSLKVNSENGEIDIVKSISLTVDQINNLTVDQLLDLKSRSLSITVDSTTNGVLDIRWSDTGSFGSLDITKDREDLIINAIKALQLRIRLEKAGSNYHKKSLSEILKLGDKMENKSLISRIFDFKFGDEPKSKEVGFNDIFNVISSVSLKNKSLDTMGGRVNFIIDKLALKDTTEIVFTILSLAALGNDSDDE